MSRLSLRSIAEAVSNEYRQIGLSTFALRVSGERSLYAVALRTAVSERSRSQRPYLRFHVLAAITCLIHREGARPVRSSYRVSKPSGDFARHRVDCGDATAPRGKRRDNGLPRFLEAHNDVANRVCQPGAR